MVVQWLTRARVWAGAARSRSVSSPGCFRPTPTPVCQRTPQRAIISGTGVLVHVSLSAGRTRG